MEEEKSSSQTSPFVNQETTKNIPLPWVEKNGFPHWLMGILWVVVAWIAFNFVGLIATIIAGIAVSENPGDINALMETMLSNGHVTFFANTVGQITVIGFGSLLIVRLSSIKSQRKQFLRLKITSNTLQTSLLAVLLTIVIFPTVTFLGWLNSFLPVPDMLAEMQQTMADMISSFLKKDNILFLALFYIGVVPAVCEEIMFRGYVMRSLEKSWGVMVAIFVSGLIFGLYHLQITNILPLSALGILFAYVTYISDSLIPAMVAHLVNNGGQVVLSKFYPEMLDAKITPDTEMPFLLIFISMILTSGLLFLMHKMKTNSEE